MHREPEKTYHAAAKDNLSSHQLADFRKCPFLYRKKKLGLVVEKPRTAFLVGRAAHSLILEGDGTFDRNYMTGKGPINPKTDKPYGPTTKKYLEWAELQTKEILTETQMVLVEQIRDGVRQNPSAAHLLKSGEPELVIREAYEGHPCQIRMDWLNADSLVDLKTCDDLSYFESDARRYGYAHQLAFYRAVLAIHTCETRPVHIIAVEKKEPYRCGVWLMGQDVLGIAQRENEDAMGRLMDCEKSDHWPTDYEDERMFDYL